MTVEVDSRASWLRLCVLITAGSVGCVGMWSVVVTLPAVQAEFGVARAGASLPYTLTMLGFAAGAYLSGRVSDRFGLARTTAGAGLLLGVGYVLASFAPSLLVYSLVHGVFVGLLGGSAFFSPLLADASRWFQRRRGLAVSIAAAGNYLGGAAWPPLIEWLTRTHGWRTAELTVGLICAAVLVPLASLLRGAPPPAPAGADAVAGARSAALGLSPRTLQLLLSVAGVGCCVAMAMPQVHLVAYCGDLGYGPARGAQMLSLMLALGVVSRIGSGFVADRIGGLGTTLLGSAVQALCLSLYLGFTSLPSLWIISALFGLFQGGIVPSYALIVREFFPAKEAGARVGMVIGATIVGMALGGWLSGAIFDRTGSYELAFANGVAWNCMNLLILGGLFLRARGHGRLGALA